VKKTSGSSKKPNPIARNMNKFNKKQIIQHNKKELIEKELDKEIDDADKDI